MSTSKDTVPGLVELVDRLISAEDGRETAYANVMTAIKKSIQAGKFEEAGAAIGRVATADLDYTQIQSLSRLYHKCREHCQKGLQPLKLAVLSSATTTQLVEFIELFLFAWGVAAEVYEAEFGLFRQEIIDPGSNLYRFAPGAIFIATNWRDLTRLPSIGDDAARVDEMLAAEQAEWSKLWHMAHERAGCQIIQNNFDHPLWRQLGNHEMRHPASQGQFITRMNQSFQESAPPFVTLHDIDGLSSSIGRRSWGDERLFHHAKLPCAAEHLVEYAHSVASVLLAQMGMSKKCLVLDLDNTLWGGVIGDDGLGGIRLGQGDAEGEAFLAFQRYVRKLSERGVILAVCSKNNEAVAREAFEKHPEMCLTLNDISCFVANWDDKAANIRSIAKQLNIGLNSLVFIDDNPAERAIVRKLLPEVTVPEVGVDPVDFITAIERNRYFQVVALGREDFNRTSYYLANAERQQTASSAESIESFLQSLEMTAKVGPINEVTLERSTQLINKSNQFNVTTIRRSAAEVQAISKNPNWVTLTASLRDRFGDNGLISVVLARVNENALEIDTWLMSCRVLKRNVEQMLLNELCTIARSRGLKNLRGQYIATPKNELVKDLYPTLGFRTVAQDESRASYELDVDGFQAIKTYIAVEKQS